MLLRLAIAPLVIGLAACGSGSDAIDAIPPVDATFEPCTPASGTNLALQEVVRGLEKPLFVTSPPGDARLFVVEQPGRIRIVDANGAGDPPFLDITDRARDIGFEQGLLGLAFHPGYAENGRFFVNYTRSDDATVIAQFTVSSDPNRANDDEKVLLTVPQPFTNHNGGMLAFGPDGYLYVGMGDGGSRDDPEDNGQDRTTMLGSMLRIDVDGGDPYGIPSSNPYADSANGAGDPRPEIWSIGLRNPWRYSFDRQTGDLYIGDVGQNAWEEVNVQPASSSGDENYGWRIAEADHCRDGANCDLSGFVAPIAEYAHTGEDGPCSVTGGYVYRGSCLPDYQGVYFYGDYCTNQVWTLRYPDETTPVEQSANLATGVLQGLSSFGQDEAGELYITSIGDGIVYRIVHGGP